MKKLLVMTASLIMIAVLLFPSMASSQEVGTEEKNCRTVATSPDAPIEVSCVGHGSGCTTVFDCLEIFDPE
jgi:hypothetical protein